ncbi:hypothetical protein J7M22_13560 [Candidatus Poribacteria bacterium]|nr:hypothetical protein [Candidatus Poribacteria bacterium]
MTYLAAFLVTVVLAASTASNDINDVLIEGIKHYDGMLRSYTVATEEQIIYYKDPLKDKFLSKPIKRTFWGRFSADGHLKSVIRKNIEVLPSGNVRMTVEKKTIFDGEKVIEQIIYSYGHRLPGREYHIFPPSTYNPFKSEDFDPKYWLGYYGTPLGKLLTGNTVSDISFREELISGERCFRIKAKRSNRELEFLVNTERGYRPQEVIIRREGRWTRIKIHLVSDGHGIWYPSEVKLKDYDGPFDKGKLLLEKHVRFTRFKGNTEIPRRHFIVVPDEFDSVYDHRRFR